jgi:primosomal protein N'
MNGAAILATALQPVEDITVQGPVPALVSKVRNFFIHEVWIKCPRDRRTLERVKAMLIGQKQQILGQRGNSSLQVLFDVDPV